MPKADLTDKFLSNVKPAPANTRVIYWDTRQRGLGLLVTDTGHKSFVVQYQVGSGRAARTMRRMHLRDITAVADARLQASVVIGQVSVGRLPGQKPVDPLEQRRQAEKALKDEQHGTFRAIASDWFNREGKKRRSGKRRLSDLQRLAFPMLGHRQIGDIKRKDIGRLLDQIEETSGPGAADYVLAAMGRVMSWHVSRTDDFVSPIVRGMARTKAKDRKRTRVLDDDELRKIWQAADATPGPYGAFVQFLLLTGTRRDEAADMPRSELAGNVWTIAAARYKTAIDHVVPLSAAATAVLNRLPVIGGGRWMFTATGDNPLGSFTVRKARFDKACGVSGWTLHDLRRTARSLMSRAGVNTDIAERCLGHVIGGVRGVYDRHAYIDEKADAFEALAAQIDRIVNPPADNVASLDERRARRAKGRRS